MPQRAQATRGGHDDGFSLVELLVAIVVLSVLAGIVVFGVAQFRGDSRNEACRADRHIVSTAANAYALQRGRYPSSLTDLEREGYLRDPPSGVTYSFDGDTNRVEQESCTL